MTLLDEPTTLNVEAESDERGDSPMSAPNEAMQENAGKAVEWGATGDLPFAKALIAGTEMDRAAVEGLVEWFVENQESKNEVGFREGEEGFPNDARIAWEAHGGNEGFSWALWVAARFLRQEDDPTGRVAPPESVSAPMKVPQEVPPAADTPATSAPEGTVEDVEDDEPPVPDEPLTGEDTNQPVHGVLVIEGEDTGDGRRFAPGSLTWRDLPIPLRWVRQDTGQHDNAITVGKITDIWRVGREVLGSGVLFADVAETDEVMTLMAEGLGGISVDVDSVEGQQDGLLGMDTTEFTAGRISAATLVAIPAFAGARWQLGSGNADEDISPIPDVEDPASLVASTSGAYRDYTEQQRKDMAEKGWALPDGSYPIADVTDLKNAIQAIGRAADPAKARAHIKKRAKALGESDLIPENWAATTETFKRGSGWITHPKETNRLHDYWVRGAGAAKIRWGTGGDWTRCTRQLRKYISPQFLKRTCAEWHHDALGYWPGECGRPGNPPCGASGDTMTASAATILAAAPPAEVALADFDNPRLNGPTPLSFSGDRVFGHLATWGVCHISMDRVCVEAPHSQAEYAFFRTGVIGTDQGEIPVGTITMNTGHADHALGANATVSTLPTTTGSDRGTAFFRRSGTGGLRPAWPRCSLGPATASGQGWTRAVATSRP